MKNILLIGLIFCGVRAWSFESAIHGEISRQAFRVLDRCGGGPVSAEQQTALAQGTVDEDTTQLVSRLRNWHFYNTYGNLKQGGVFFESLDHIFVIRNQELAAAAPDSTARAHAEGRVLHYIQDMFVPAHVVPVFHGKPFAKVDEFDHYALAAGAKDQAVEQIDCGEIQIQGPASFQANRDLLDQSAHGTLDMLKSPIGDSKVPWSYFWQAPVSQANDDNDTGSTLVSVGVHAKRFGTYVGKFGEDSFVAPGEYEKFYAHQYREAVKASAKFILLNR